MSAGAPYDWYSPISIAPIPHSRTILNRNYHRPRRISEGHWPLIGDEGYPGELGGLLENVGLRPEESWAGRSRQKVKWCARHIGISEYTNKCVLD